MWKDTALWSLYGLGKDRPQVDECYEAMDRLLERQWHMQSRRAGTRSAVRRGWGGRGTPLDLERSSGTSQGHPADKR